MERAAPFLWFALIPTTAWALFWWASRTRRTAIKLVAGVVAGASCLTLLASIRLKTIDISDFWPLLIFCAIPTLTILVIIVARKIESDWIRVPTRFVSFVLTLITGFLLFILLLSHVACRSRPIRIDSPDGKHVAFVTYNQQGMLGYDTAFVDVRKSWHPFTKVVFSGYGYASPRFPETSPEIHWISASHLQIRYRNLDVMRPALCETDKLDIRVTCELIPRGSR